MKKLFCVLLSLTMIFALCACGGGDKNAPETPSESPAAETPAADPETTTTDAEAPATDSEVPAADAEAPAEDGLKPFSIGVVDGNTYESKYLGIGCTVPEGWTLLAADELQELGDIVDELMEKTDYASIPAIMDMYAINENSSNSINIRLTLLSDVQRTVFAHMSEEEIVETAMSSKDTLIAQYEQSGATVNSVEAEVIEFLGEEHHAIKTEVSMNGMDLTIIQLSNFNIGGEYAATITFNANTDEDVAEIVNMFYTLD